MPFVKLDCGILNSTLWFEKDCRDVFMTALLMAEPHELVSEVPQISVDALEPTGWMVPAGWYGFVPAAGIGIIHRAQVPEERGRDALRQLGEPESTSRTQDFEGRRLVRVDGGYLVLNYMRYRDRDYTAAARAKRYRDRMKSSQRNDTPSHPHVTQAEYRLQSTDLDAKAEAGKSVAPAREPAMGRGLVTSSLAWDRQHGTHVAGFCDWLCLPSDVYGQLAGRLGGEAEAMAFAQRTRARFTESGQVPSGRPWQFWEAQLAVEHPPSVAATSRAQLDPLAGVRALEDQERRRG
jgi:hypothetical protein